MTKGKNLVKVYFTAFVILGFLFAVVPAYADYTQADHSTSSGQPSGTRNEQAEIFYPGLNGILTGVSVWSGYTNFGGTNLVYADVYSCPAGHYNFADCTLIGLSTSHAPSGSASSGAKEDFTYSTPAVLDPTQTYLLSIGQVVGFGGDNRIFGSATDVDSSMRPALQSESNLVGFNSPVGDFYLNIKGALKAPFYAQIKNTSGGYSTIYSASSTSSTAIKRLPQDWVVNISTTTDINGSHVVADGYNWYRVTDPTDGVSGWMAGQNASSTIQYLNLPSDQQAQFASTSDSYVATSSRPDIILQAIDDYYNNASTSYSLYSSDDNGNTISSLNSGGFPEEIIPGIAAREDGNAFGFDNEKVSFDYGHGIMQITPYHVFANEPISSGDWVNNSGDNRGYASGIKIYPCTSDASNLYADCYTYGGAADSVHSKSYQPYAGNPSNPTYKYYTNTVQSIYSNIKDGLQILADKFSSYSGITGSVVVGGTTYTASDRKAILAVEHYNGSCGYVDNVADELDSITGNFPTATTSSITGLIGKMHDAGSNMVCASLESPATIAIEDNSGRVVGVKDENGINDFPLAIYDQKEKSAKILAADLNTSYRFIVTGDSDAKPGSTYGINLMFRRNGKVTKFHAKGIPIVQGEIHTYSVDVEGLGENAPNSISIDIDKNGDGVVEKTIKAGPGLNAETFESAEVSPEGSVSTTSLDTDPPPADIVDNNN